MAVAGGKGNGGVAIQATVATKIWISEERPQSLKALAQGPPPAVWALLAAVGHGISRQGAGAFNPRKSFLHCELRELRGQELARRYGEPRSDSVREQRIHGPACALTRRHPFCHRDIFLSHLPSEAILQQLLDGPDDFFAVFIGAIEGVHDKDSKEAQPLPAVARELYLIL